ncbi:MAG: PAS domain S-box protein [Fidelibacterota bacterium]
MTLYVCENMRADAETAVKELNLPEISIITYPARCGRPPIKITEMEELMKNDTGPHLVLGGVCLHQIKNKLEPNTTVRIFDNCFEMFMDKGLINYFIRKGAYITNSGWLTDWEKHLKDWQFDRKTAREFFRESCKYILLLDTGIDSQSDKNLQEFTQYIDRPAEKITLDTRRLQAIIRETLEAGNYPFTEKTSAPVDLRQLADYAMSMDLVQLLARNLNEKAVIENILNTFTMLFAPEELYYLRYEASKPEKLYNKNGEIVKDSAIKNRLSSLEKDYKWQSSGKGFLLQINFNNELLGVISVDSVAFPQYKDHYLNLALFLTKVCGLAVANARRYEIITAQNEKLDNVNREINKREEYYRQLFNNAPVGYQSLDAEGVILNVNQAWKNTLGYDSDEVIGKEFRNFLEDQEKPKYDELSREFIKTGKFQDIEFKMVKKNGDLIDVSYSGKVIRDMNDKIIGTHGIFRDITRQKEIFKTLEKEAREGKHLAGFISICAACNNIKDQDIEGHPWVKPAKYFSRRYPDLRFSHGICPDCIKKLYPDLKIDFEK